MNSPTQPLTGTLRAVLSPPSSIEQARGEAAAVLTELASVERGLAIEAGRGTPPPEVLAQIARAASIHDAMRASGRTVRFTLAREGGVAVAVHDADGALLRTLCLTEAHGLACAGPVE